MNSNIPQIYLREDFDVILKNLGLDNGKYVEIGVWRSRFSKCIHRWNIHKSLTLIDPWTNGLTDYNDKMNETPQEDFDKLHQNCLDLFKDDSRVTVLRDKAENVVDQFEDGSLDFVFLDGNHNYKNAKMDIGLWVPKVKKGGVFAFHDFFDLENNLGEFGVKRAIEEYIHGKDINIHLLNREDTSGYFIKK